VLIALRLLLNIYAADLMGEGARCDANASQAGCVLGGQETPKTQ